MSPSEVVILTIVAALIGAIGTWLVGFSGMLTVRLTQQKNRADAIATRDKEQQEKLAAERQYYDSIAQQSFQMIDRYRTEVNDMRKTSAEAELHQAKEMNALRQQVQLLKEEVSDVRADNHRLTEEVNDLKAENAQLKTELRDARQNITDLQNQTGSAMQP